MANCNICGKKVPVTAFIFNSHPHRIICSGCESGLVADRETMHRMTIALLVLSMVGVVCGRYIFSAFGIVHTVKFFIVMVLVVSMMMILLNASVGKFSFREGQGSQASCKELLKFILFFPIFLGVGFGFFKAFSLAVLLTPLFESRGVNLVFIFGSWFMASVTITLVFRYPLAFLYKKESVLIAALCLFPIVTTMELLDFNRKPLTVLLNWFDFFVLSGLFVFGTFRAHKNLTARSGPLSLIR